MSAIGSPEWQAEFDEIDAAFAPYWRNPIIVEAMLGAYADRHSWAKALIEQSRREAASADQEYTMLVQDMYQFGVVVSHDEPSSYDGWLAAEDRYDT